MLLFILSVAPEIIITVLVLLEMFNCTRPLIVFLLKWQDSLCISQAQTVVDVTLLNLKNILHKKTYFTQEGFGKINLEASEQVLLLPPPTNLRCQPLKFSSFQNYTYTKFITTFEE